jgi:hypothetical protein
MGDSSFEKHLREAPSRCPCIQRASALHHEPKRGEDVESADQLVRGTRDIDVDPVDERQLSVVANVPRWPALDFTVDENAARCDEIVCVRT